MLLLLALPWFFLVPGAIWRGVAVIERCDAKAEENFGDSVYAIRGKEHVRWWWPAWSCPLSNGERVNITGW